MTWRIMDALEAIAAFLWPARFNRAVPYLMLLPAIVLVGLLVLGLIQIADTSLRTLDTSTFLMSDYYTLANYKRALTESLFATVAWRSLLGSLVVTFFTLVLAFPYAYLMVRTPSAALRKFLLIALFLPFFIGQVVRAYGWLIILGNQGMVNEALGLVGIAPLRLLYNYPAVLFGLVQYMLPFAVLMLAPALTAIPEEMEAAASSLGANWVRTFAHVVLPMARARPLWAGGVGV
jgi:putative spermidine/putrescine transport system permease protein